jgi:diguanylate cyclase (GGDEF)-like protein/PAS domain S-box-containing protein
VGGFVNHDRLRKKLRIYVFLALVPVFVVSIFFVYTNINQLTYRIARDYAQFKSNDLISEIDAYIEREITLSLSVAQSDEVIDWMKDEEDPLKFDLAYNDLTLYKSFLNDSNFFVATDVTKNFYFIEKNQGKNELVPLYVLDETMSEDVWYFKTKEDIEVYDLNIDFDRFLKTIRVWINVVVKDENEFVGVLGTGLLLDPILEDIFEETNETISKSVIIDEFGAIQLDSNIENIRENSFDENVDESKSIFSMHDTEEFRTEVSRFLRHPEEAVLMELTNSHYNFAMFSPIASTDWYVVTFYDASELYSFRNFVPLIFLMLILYIGFSIAINQIVLIAIIKPLEFIKKSIQEDRYNEINEMGKSRDDEIGELASTVDTMRSKLEDYSVQLQEKVQLQSDELDRIFSSTPIGITILKEDKTIYYSNDYFDNLFGVDESVLGTHFNLLVNRSTDCELVNNYMSTNEQIPFEIQMKSMNKNIIWCEVRILKYVEKEELYYQVLITDVSKKKEYEEKLIEYAIKDSLTGIFNRRHFEKLMNEEIYRVNRYHHSLSVVLFDIDNFKSINDQYGHDIGDEILVKLTKLVSKSIRHSDVFARWGGEEFILLLKETGIETAYEKAEKLRVLFEESDFSPVAKVTSSFGVIEKRPEETYLEMFSRVDNALYKAKNLGRNNVKRG